MLPAAVLGKNRLPGASDSAEKALRSRDRRDWPLNREEANASQWLDCLSPSQQAYSLPMVGFVKDSG